MASPYTPCKWTKDTSFEERTETYVYIFDRRTGNAPEIKLHTSDLRSFADFRERLIQALKITTTEPYVITTTSRDILANEDDWENIEPGDTLYVLKSIDQELTAQTEEKVTYLPHYDTIVKGGMYEYYASEGQNPIPYAFAELIDNALSATADNDGPRKIELILHMDTHNPSQSVIFVIDNGRGMTSHQLNNWAVYRLSKFNRRDDKFSKTDNGNTSLSRDNNSTVDIDNADSTSVGRDNTKRRDAKDRQEHVPRSLNSDISYFGVGGKQAIFFIGNSTRMISRAKGSKDVHELTISKEEFERKEKNKESIYSGIIRNRKAGDASHLPPDDDILQSIIADEPNKDSFTTVVINGINPSFIPYLKLNVKEWTRQLAHIYHYYIHGPQGNLDESQQKSNNTFNNIDIQVKLYTRASGTKESRELKTFNLRDIDEDMQTLYIRTAADTFEFKATIESAVVEGLIRYHPFLYDRETFPSDRFDARAEAETEDDHEYYSTTTDLKPARGKRPVFECYWNGRLIPYTYIEDFEWCRAPKKSKNLPVECYNRISGVLWTNDQFQVSTNKLTFIDLEMRLHDKNSTYTRVIGPKIEKRTAIEKEFATWLTKCHANHDKQILFSSYTGNMTRLDLPRSKQTPWATFEQIEWDCRVFKKGDIVRISRTLPIFYGKIKRFLLHGDHDSDVYATGGDLELTQEPNTLYEETKIVPLTKLDRVVTNAQIRKALQDEETKLPAELKLEWPEGDQVKEGDKIPVGHRIGDMQISILNKRGESINRLPGHSMQHKKLLVEMKVKCHVDNRKETIVSHISQHSKSWAYWFKKMENSKKLGPHTIELRAMLNESGIYSYSGIDLPSLVINFTVVEAEAQSFNVGAMDPPFRIGSPFSIPLTFQDCFGNTTKPTDKLLPKLSAGGGLEISYKKHKIEDGELVLHDVVGVGKVSSNSGQTFTLTITVPGLRKQEITHKIRLLPGPPHSVKVLPNGPIDMENGEQQEFDIEVHDIAGNLATQPKLIVMCEFSGVANLPTYTLDCSNTGQGCLRGHAINIPDMNASGKELTATISVKSLKSVEPVKRKIIVHPSHKPASITLSYTDEKGKVIDIENNGEILATAGDYIRNITFNVKDESDREVDISKLENKLKVNWAPKLSSALILSGVLPDLRASSTVPENKYCVVTLHDTACNIQTQFYVKSQCGAASQIKCQLKGSNTVRLGEDLASDIQVDVMDKHGNVVKKLEKGVLKDLSVECDGLVVDDTVRMLGQHSGFNISSLKFQDCRIGNKEVKVIWRDFVDFVRVVVQAGVPTKLIVDGWGDLAQPVTVYNECKLPQRLVVQLVDAANNVTSAPNVKVQLAKEPGLKFTPAPQPLKADKNGKADFGLLAVSGKRGVYEVQAKAFLGRGMISGQKVKICIQPDPTKATSITVEYDKSDSYIVGQPLPDFHVCVLNEEGTAMSGIKPSHLSMKMWHNPGHAARTKPPAGATNWHPDTRRKNDTPGHFFFKRTASQQAGSYCIIFCYVDGNKEIYSNQVTMVLSPAPVCKLCPEQAMATPTVSNTRNADSRLLVDKLTLIMQDQYDNQAGLDTDGTILLEIVRLPTDTGNEALPKFDGKKNKIEVELQHGRAIVENILISENSPGKDGQEYVLKCSLQHPDVPKNMAVAPYMLNFFFYNDVKKQAQMAALTRERDEIKNTIQAYKSLFYTAQQLVDELKLSANEAKAEENKIKSQLKKVNISQTHLGSAESVDKLIADCESMKESVVSTPRRMCALQPAVQHEQVLGKIAHLAEVDDQDIARVLSWHMSADMDCVVTMTTQKAKEIYNKSGGRQQVLPLDSIFRKNLPDWRKPLPHERIRSCGAPTGNPMYARNALSFPNHDEQCRIVFGMLLGDTIILDTLDDANKYRQEIVKHTHCPTILTRQGDRIRSNGKFGGLMNKALPIDKLKGVIFAAPISHKLDKYNAQIELLQNYKSVLGKREEAEQELAKQLAEINAVGMREKREQCKKAEQQLLVIERKLVNPERYHDNEDGNSDAPVPAKRSRLSSGAAKATGQSQATTTRHSRRSGAAADSRKRHK